MFNAIGQFEGPVPPPGEYFDSLSSQQNQETRRPEDFRGPGRLAALLLSQRPMMGTN
jgi:hypothetical protein